MGPRVWSRLTTLVPETRRLEKEVVRVVPRGEIVQPEGSHPFMCIADTKEKVAGQGQWLICTFLIVKSDLSNVQKADCMSPKKWSEFVETSWNSLNKICDWCLLAWCCYQERYFPFVLDATDFYGKDGHQVGPLFQVFAFCGLVEMLGTAMRPVVQDMATKIWSNQTGKDEFLCTFLTFFGYSGCWPPSQRPATCPTNRAWPWRMPGTTDWVWTFCPQRRPRSRPVLSTFELNSQKWYQTTTPFPSFSKFSNPFFSGDETEGAEEWTLGHAGLRRCHHPGHSDGQRLPLALRLGTPRGPASGGPGLRLGRTQSTQSRGGQASRIGWLGIGKLVGFFLGMKVGRVDPKLQNRSKQDVLWSHQILVVCTADLLRLQDEPSSSILANVSCLGRHARWGGVQRSAEMFFVLDAKNHVHFWHQATTSPCSLHGSFIFL